MAKRRNPDPFSVRFHVRPAAPPEPERAGLYQQALELSARVFTVVELAEVERYYIRDQLERKSTGVPQLVAQGLATADMRARRALWVRARKLTTDCLTILDVLHSRGTVEPEAITAAREVGAALAERLDELTVAPPAVW